MDGTVGSGNQARRFKGEIEVEEVQNHYRWPSCFIDWRNIVSVLACRLRRCADPTKPSCSVSLS